MAEKGKYSSAQSSALAKSSNPMAMKVALMKMKMHAEVYYILLHHHPSSPIITHHHRHRHPLTSIEFDFGFISPCPHISIPPFFLKGDNRIPQEKRFYLEVVFQIESGVVPKMMFFDSNYSIGKVLDLVCDEFETKIDSNIHRRSRMQGK